MWSGLVYDSDPIDGLVAVRAVTTTTSVVQSTPFTECVTMSRKPFALATALALLGLMFAAPSAKANYTYTAALNITSFSGTTGTIVNTPNVGATFTSTGGTVVTLGDIITPGTFLVGNPLSANFGNVAVTTTSTTPESFSVFYTLNGSLTNPSPGGTTVTATTTGVLTFSGIETSGGAFGGTVTNQYLGPFSVSGPVGGDIFTTTVPVAVNGMFGPPTIGAPPGSPAAGNIGGLILSEPIPEPASLAMLGTGLAGVLGLGLRQRRRATV
jgi:hypothetical protein